MRRGRQRVDVQPDEIGDEEEQTATGGGEAARFEGELACVGHGLDPRPRTLRPFLIQTARQGREAFFPKHLADGRRTQPQIPLFQRLADFVHGEVLFAEGDDGGPGRGLFRLAARAPRQLGEEDGMRIPAEVVT
jgi:hypothetical protein